MIEGLEVQIPTPPVDVWKCPEPTALSKNTLANQ